MEILKNVIFKALDAVIFIKEFGKPKPPSDLENITQSLLEALEAIDPKATPKPKIQAPLTEDSLKLADDRVKEILSYDEERAKLWDSGEDIPPPETPPPNSQQKPVQGPERASQRQERVEVPWKPQDVLNRREIPAHKGWKLLALITHDDNGTSVTPAYNEHVPKNYYIDAQKCDQCNKPLFRRYTFIIQNLTTQEIRQVGSTCVKKFFEDIEKVTPIY